MRAAAVARWRACDAHTAQHDLVCSEWATNHHRDSYASHVGHADVLTYFAVAENEAVGRVRFTMLEVSTRPLQAPLPTLPQAHHLARGQKMLQPCGPPPEKEEE